MPQQIDSDQAGTEHYKGFSGNSELIHDIVLGFADGLTVPFALTAGLSSLGSSKLVVVGGLAELLSGAISMGLGAYLAVNTSRDRYFSEQERKKYAIEHNPEAEMAKCRKLLEQYNVTREASGMTARDLCMDLENCVQFMMDFELKLERPTPSRAWSSAATIGTAYFLGGIIPMIPYFALSNVSHALFISISITAVTLLSFGFIKDWVIMRRKSNALKGAVQTLIVGGLAAAASYGIVKAIDSSNLS